MFEIDDKIQHLWSTSVFKDVSTPLTQEIVENAYNIGLNNYGKVNDTFYVGQAQFDQTVKWFKRDEEWKALGPILYKQRYLKLRLLNRKTPKYLNLPE